MFYLWTHLTHCINDYKASENIAKKRERKLATSISWATFSDYLLRLYGVGHMVNDHSDSEKANPLPPHDHLQRTFYMHHPIQDITYHGPCYISTVTLGGMTLKYLTNNYYPMILKV